MLGEFLEKNLQEPFFMAEMHKVQMSAARETDENLVTIKALAVFGAVYMSFCVYWFGQYIAG